MSTPNQSALVTGASTGIGAVYAHRLAKRGYDLILVARDRSKLDEVAANIRKTFGKRVDAIGADLSSPSGLAEVEKRLLEDPSISLLVNNAGMHIRGTLLDSETEETEQMLRLNVVAVTRLALAAAKVFASRGTGAVVNIGSVTTFLPEHFGGVYSASKAFILHLTQSLHAQVSDKGVRFQAVLPGATRTTLWGKAGVDINTLPPEMVMEPEEAVDAALAGFDLGELVTLPSLPEVATWEAYEQARFALAPGLSRQHPAKRYLAKS